MIKLNVSLGIGIANATQSDVLEIDETEWNDCETDDERDKLKEQYWQDWANNFIDGGYWLSEDT